MALRILLLKQLLNVLRLKYHNSYLMDFVDFGMVLEFPITKLRRINGSQKYNFTLSCSFPGVNLPSASFILPIIFVIILPNFFLSEINASCGQSLIVASKTVGVFGKYPPLAVNFFLRSNNLLYQYPKYDLMKVLANDIGPVLSDLFLSKLF